MSWTRTFTKAVFSPSCLKVLNWCCVTLAATSSRAPAVAVAAIAEDVDIGNDKEKNLAWCCFYPREAAHTAECSCSRFDNTPPPPPSPPRLSSSSFHPSLRPGLLHQFFFFIIIFFRSRGMRVRESGWVKSRTHEILKSFLGSPHQHMLLSSPLHFPQLCFYFAPSPPLLLPLAASGVLNVLAHVPLCRPFMYSPIHSARTVAIILLVTAGDPFCLSR